MKKVVLTLGLSVATTVLPFSTLIAGQAVSKINAKVEAIGGNTDGDGAQALQGSLTVPLGTHFGGQVDVLGGKISSDTLTGAGGHLFWRNPEIGLVGITASQSRLDKIDFSRYGAEAEYYLNNFTFSLYGGRQEGDVPNTGYSGLAASYYITENILIQLGGETVSDQHNANMSMEWQPEFTPNGVSFFANGMRGNNDLDAVYAGIKYYWGDSKSLKDRHRKDDPANQLFNNYANTINILRAANECPTTTRIVNRSCGVCCTEAFRQTVDCSGNVVSEISMGGGGC